MESRSRSSRRSRSRSPSYHNRTKPSREHSTHRSRERSPRSRRPSDRRSEYRHETDRYDRISNSDSWRHRDEVDPEYLSNRYHKSERSSSSRRDHRSDRSSSSRRDHRSDRSSLSRRDHRSDRSPSRRRDHRSDRSPISRSKRFGTDRPSKDRTLPKEESRARSKARHDLDADASPRGLERADGSSESHRSSNAHERSERNRLSREKKQYTEGDIEKEKKAQQNLESMVDELVAGEDESDYEDEATKLERLREERRERRQAIMSEYGSSNSSINSSVNHDSADNTKRQYSSTSKLSNQYSDTHRPDKLHKIDSADNMPHEKSQSKVGSKVVNEKPWTSTTSSAAKLAAIRESEAKEQAQPNNENISMQQTHAGQDTQASAQPPADDFDMFADDIPISDDVELDTTRKRNSGTKLEIAEVEGTAPFVEGQGPRGTFGHGEDNPALLDNWDDAEGYLRVQVGELLADRYRVVVASGKGVFSSVAICKDTQPHRQQDDIEAEYEQVDTIGHNNASQTVLPMLYDTVAIKMLRANDTMRKAGMKELHFLQLLGKADVHHRNHIIQLLHHVEHRNHLCLVFEPMFMNLREVLDKYGKTMGINVGAVRLYTKQLLISLNALRRFEIIHADIKPHNILTNDKFTLVKLADFGSAFRESDPENEPTPLLVSRFYRAPEIMLGCRHSTALDMWSLGCVLYELYTGRVLFPGVDNNDMLWLQMQLRGRFPNKMVRQHIRQAELLGIQSHFDEDLRFIHDVQDPVSKSIIKRREVIADKPVVELGTRLLGQRAGEDSRKLVKLFKDLLERMLTLDPHKRITVREALKHPFLASMDRKNTNGSTGK